MQNVEWLAYGITSALTRTAVHFFPCQGDLSAPYPVRCELTMFSSGMAPKRIAIDGARLSQPDGVRIDDAFPQLRKSEPGQIGLLIDLSTSQPRVDLSGSACVVEFESSAGNVRYWPVRASMEGQGDAGDVAQVTRKLVPVVKDAYNFFALVGVNFSATPLEVRARLVTAGRSLPAFEVVGGQSEAAGAATIVPPGSVVDLAINEKVFEAAQPQELTWGLARAANLVIEYQRRAGCALYLVARDQRSHRPMSVRGL